MNGIDRITARIEADAAREAAQIAQDAQQEAARLCAEAEKKAQDSYWQRLREGMKAIEARSARLAGTADMEAKKNILSFKQEVVASAFENAMKQLLSMPEQDYVQFLTDKALAACETGREELVFSARDQKKLGQTVLDAVNAKLTAAGKIGQVTASEKTGDFSAGLVVRRGSVEYNCTVDALMAQAKEELSAEVAAILFS